jgi:hypothetical protein
MIDPALIKAVGPCLAAVLCLLALALQERRAK